MEIKNRKNIIIITVCISISVAIILIVIGLASRDKNYKPSSWVLKSYGNNVALYNGENLETVYGGITLDNLPSEDVDILESGIAFPSRKEAEQAIEDYDG